MPKTNADGVALIKGFESFRARAYLCPAGKWTIGYGHTGDVAAGMTVTEHQADVILGLDLDTAERDVAAMCPGATENQFSALVSFVFNLGGPALYRSTLRTHFLAGRIDEAAAEFGKWIYAGGKVLPGLVKRRAAERELFLKG